MGAVTYPNDKVVKFVDYNFIPVQIQVSNTALMQQFKISWTPTLILLDADGNEKYRVVGFQAADDFIATFMVAKGRFYFDREEYPEALGMFEEALTNYPQSQPAAEAIFFQGVARYKSTHDPKPLRESYETLTARFPQSEWTKRADPYRLIPK